MQISFKYGGILSKGDLIAVSSGNYIDVGFFRGFGSGTLQYYSVWGINYQDEKLKELNKSFTLKGLSCCYINSVNKKRVMKVTPEVFTDQEDIDNYYKAIEALKSINFIN